MPDKNFASMANNASPTAILQGVNTVLGKGLYKALDGKVEEEGGEDLLRCNVALDIQELATSLSLDQSFSVGFGPMAVDQKLKFLSELNITTTSVSLLIYCRKVLKIEKVTNAWFIEPEKLTGNLDAFVRSYGDSYVNSLTKGGEFIGIYVFYSQSKDEQKSLAFDLTAKGISPGMTVDASAQVKIDNFLKTTNTRYSYQAWRSGVSEQNFPGAEPTNVISYAIEFSGKKPIDPKVIGFTTSGYENVYYSDNIFMKIQENRTYFLGNAFQGGLIKSLVKIEMILDQIAKIKQVYDYYGYEGDKVLLENEQVFINDLTAIKNQISAFQNNATTDFEKLPLPSLKIGFPTLNELLVSESPRWGGTGGAGFDLPFDLATYHKRKISMTKIAVRSGKVVDQLEVTYNDSEGKVYKRTYGGDGGGDQGSMELLRGDHIRSIAGRSGTRLDKVVLTTKKGRTLSGGDDTGGSPFTWSVPDGAFVIGFRGKAGLEIDALQVIYATLQPAKWGLNPS